MDRNINVGPTLTKENQRWMHIPGDTILFLGAVSLVIFIAGLTTGHSFKRSAMC